MLQTILIYKINIMMNMVMIFLKEMNFKDIGKDMEKINKYINH